MPGVHNSTNANEYVGCNISSTASSSYLTCFARDATSRYVSCWSDSPYHVNAIQALTADSYVSFNWDTTGRCTNVTFETSSWSPAKKLPPL